MKFLVTGATGFLGRHLVARSGARSTRSSPLCRDDEPELAAEGVTVRGATCSTWRACAAPARGATAFSTAPATSRASPTTPKRCTACTSRDQAVLDACRAAGVRRVVVASTSGTSPSATTPTTWRPRTTPRPSASCRALALLPRQALRRARRARAQRARVRGRVVNPSSCSARATSAAPPRRTCGCLLERRGPGGARGRPVVRRRARRGRRDAPRDAARARPASATCRRVQPDVPRFLRRACADRRRARAVAADAAVAGAGEARGQALEGRSRRARRGGRPGERRDGPVLLVPDPRRPTELGWAARDPLLMLRETVDDLRARSVVWWSRASFKTAGEARQEPAS